MSAGAKGELSVRGYEIVKFLIEKGADINIRDNKGNTLMHYSVLPYGNNPLVIDLLLKKGMDVNGRNRDGETPLHTVSTMEGVELLIKKGADINAKDEKGRRPLELAIQKNDLNKAHVLKEHGAKE
jgi:ankyrin repeat protein